MDDILVIGAGPAGLLAALAARKQGATARVLATGIGTTHISPGWIGVLDTPGHSEQSEESLVHSPETLRSAQGDNEKLNAALERLIQARPDHPYALTGVAALRQGVTLLREACSEVGLNYVGDLTANFKLPTALGAIKQAALVPASFAAGDVRQPGAMLIAAPDGWRDFYPKLCAENLTRQGIEARGVAFDMSQLQASSQFDMTPVGLARLFDRADVRMRVAAQLRPQLGGAARVGFPAVLGLDKPAEAWRDMQDRLGVPVFEIPTLPPSVSGVRLFNAFKRVLTRLGVQILFETTVTHGIVKDGKVIGVAVQNVVREKTYRAGRVVLATGGLYGGGIVTDRTGAMREAIFDLPVRGPGEMGEWFNPKFLSQQEHPIHTAGVSVNSRLQPVDQSGQVVLDNVRIAGRLLAGYNPLAEGSAEGVILATAYHSVFGHG
jgi:glycerol-3-phosphate dehydrogenase subunit B